MTTFILLAAGLALAAVAFVVWPLVGSRRAPRLAHDAANVAVYQDQLKELRADLDSGTLSEAQFEEARRELERRLLIDVKPIDPERGEVAPATRLPRWPVVVVAVLLPLAAALLYRQLGTPEAITASRLAGLTPVEQVEALLPALEKHLAQQPEDATGWRMLAKGYMALERYPQAAQALERAVRLLPDDAQLLADYADALAMAQGQRLAGKPRELIERALKLDPDNGKALYLAGFAALEAQDNATAARHWQRLLAHLPPDSEDAAIVRRQLSEIGVADTAAKPSVAGRVEVSEALRARVGADDTVFVFARAEQGPRMPLAILKLRGADLPARFRLDDSLAMAPQMRLSNFQRVIIGARVSRSGQATPQSGDLEGTSAPVPVGAGDVTVVIDRVVP